MKVSVPCRRARHATGNGGVEVLKALHRRRRVHVPGGRHVDRGRVNHQCPGWQPLQGAATAGQHVAHDGAVRQHRHEDIAPSAAAATESAIFDTSGRRQPGLTALG